MAAPALCKKSQAVSGAREVGVFKMLSGLSQEKGRGGLKDLQRAALGCQMQDEEQPKTVA